MSGKSILVVAIALGVLAGGGFVYVSSTGTSPMAAVTGGGAPCAAEFDELYAEHRADLSNCSISIRDGSFTPSEPVAKQNNVVLIFDSSGSMAGMSGGEQKIDAAKGAVGNFVAQLAGTDVNVSVVVYGHKGDNTETNQARSCAGIEDLYGFGEANGQKIQTTLAQFAPTGWTPIADSLERAYEILAPYNSDEYNNSIVLISDGIETCGGDPVAVVQEMNDRGVAVTANVIGFDVDAAAAQQLRAVAQNGEGEYFSAADRADLEFALERHAAFMERFDYRMRRVSENLDDINDATDRHFACVQSLETERANMMLDIYATERVSEACAEPVDQRYTELYQATRQSLWQLFAATIEDFMEKSQR